MTTIAKPEITTGTIVKYQDGHYRVTRRTKNTVNLGRVFGRGKVIHKTVALVLVQEDEQGWYNDWQTTDSYRCM